MILCPHGKPLIGGIEARAFGDRPAQQDAAKLEPEIVVKARSIVLLDEIAQFVLTRLDAARRRFGGFPKIAFASVFFKGHD